MAIQELHPQGHPLSWQERLGGATTESDVVSVAREYIATLTPEEYRALPEALRPGKVVDANDITTYAFELVRHGCQDEGAQRLVQRLGHVLSGASIRLSEIMVTEHHSTAREPLSGEEHRAA